MSDAATPIKKLTAAEDVGANTKRVSSDHKKQAISYKERRFA